MEYGYAMAVSRASLYGNDRLDVHRGFDQTSDILRSVYEFVPYRKDRPKEQDAPGAGTGDELVDIYVRMRKMLGHDGDDDGDDDDRSNS